MDRMENESTCLNADIQREYVQVSTDAYEMLESADNFRETEFLRNLLRSERFH